MHLGFSALLSWTLTSRTLIMPNIVVYIIFSIVLFVPKHFFPVSYFTATVATFLAVLSIWKWLPKLSLYILTLIVLVFTVIFPILVLTVLLKGTDLSPFAYLIPTDRQNLINFLGFCLPFGVLFFLWTVRKK